MKNKILRLMALDVGSRRIGVAISDAMGWTAQPITTLERTTLQEDFKKIEALLHEYEVDTLVVGYPQGLSQNITPQTQKVIDFVEKLKKQVTCPIEIWDESFTTRQAEEVLLEANISRRKRKKAIDKLAAVFILKSYMDSNK
ncbi:MAG: Holliday junction DNA helicase RuvA [Deltaproteobacteria bacterium RIFCSPHIGHO2_02_FULL_40_11]|nr:MAG: Holliday junction DNA helicase RuvA [Deltaproteobacteria bacterium RIFCSPHIGHO2_02_FULL_40_11]